jgi:hypothetical protein
MVYTPPSAAEQDALELARLGNGQFGSRPKTALPGGMEAAFVRPPDRRPDETVRAAQTAAQAERKLIERQQLDLGQELVTGMILDEYPGAIEAEIWNAGADDGESNFQVKQIRMADGSSWDAPESLEDVEDFEEKINDEVIAFDRLGLAHFAQQANAEHPSGWCGLKLSDSNSRRSTDLIRSDLGDLSDRDTALETAEFDLTEEMLINTILRRFDGATEAVIWNSGAEVRESCFKIQEIRGLDGVFWEAGDLFDGFEDDINDEVFSLDSRGLNHFAQPADIDHAKSWFGIKF